MSVDRTNETNKIDNYAEIWRELSKAYKIIYKGLDKSFQQHNSNVLEYRIMKHIYEEGSQAMARLAEMSYVTQAWITGMVDKLEEKGYVVRIRSNEDRRVINVDLTPSGIKFYKKMKSINDTFLEGILSFIRDDEASQMTKILHNIVERLETSTHGTDL